MQSASLIVQSPAVAQPEKSRNVQLHSRETYARASEAAHCRVHATLMLPLFEDSARSSIIGVLEVRQPHVTLPDLYIK